VFIALHLNPSQSCEELDIGKIRLPFVKNKKDCARCMSALSGNVTANMFTV